MDKPMPPNGGISTQPVPVNVSPVQNEEKTEPQVEKNAEPSVTATGSIK
jgi:hypothetical protein